MADSDEVREHVAQIVTSVVADVWERGPTLREWWAALADRQLAFPHWPEPWGRGWGRGELEVWREVLADGGAIGPPPGLGTLMGAPITLDFGTAEQQARWLPALAAGMSAWCQLFSEPGAGSDLAGLTTSAERDGDDWVVTGQKVWTSGSRHADRGMLVARTNWDVPKHRGLSYFIISMQQPGVENRPLVQMNGARHFSEVFLSEARVADADRLGDVGSGWAVATATLGYERRGLGAPKVPGPLPEPGSIAGNLDRPVGELVADHHERAGGGDIAATGSAQRLAGLAAEHSARDAELIDRLASLVTDERLADPTAARQPLVAKLAWTERLRRASAATSRALGAAGMLEREVDASDEAVRQAANFVLSVPSASIAGGTDEIQRNIIGERALGLPREPSDDRDRPFREVPRNG